MTNPEFVATAQAVHRYASELYVTSGSWWSFYGQVSNRVREAFPTFTGRQAWDQSPYAQHVAKMVDLLRRGPTPRARDEHGTRRVVTVRMPAALHTELLAAAHDSRQSLNQLCIERLLRPVLSNESDDLPA